MLKKVSSRRKMANHGFPWVSFTKTRLVALFWLNFPKKPNRVQIDCGFVSQISWYRTEPLPYRAKIAARVEGKSSLARIGMGVHITAPTIHAGFGFKENDTSFPGSSIQLEIWNIGPLTIRLQKGMRICQLIFEEVHGTPDKGYEGQFVMQGPVSE